MKHVVMYSGGIASWACARHVIGFNGPDHVTLLFADVGGDQCQCGHRWNQHINGRGPCNEKSDGEHYCGCRKFNHANPHSAEDEDTYRFIHETATAFGAELVVLNQHETIWEVFKRRKYLGNSRQANCSIELKQKPARAWLDTHCRPDAVIVYIGLTWDETHREAAIRNAYQPYTVEMPLIEPPFISKAEMLDMCRADGIEPPRLYSIGAAHNNCGGGCVRAGQATFLKLLAWNPQRFDHWARQEQVMRDQLGDVSILRDWANDGAPLTLVELRARAASDQLTLFDAEYDVGGCGCFTDTGAAV